MLNDDLLNAFQAWKTKNSNYATHLYCHDKEGGKLAQLSLITFLQDVMKEAWDFESLSLGWNLLWAKYLSIWVWTLTIA